MLIKKDNMHISFRPIDGRNKPFNIIISAREGGKSTEWVSKSYLAYNEGKTSLIIRRQVVDITEEYINSIQEIINKFYDESFFFKFNKGSLKDGIVAIYDKDGNRFGLIVALSISIARIKSLVLRNIKYIFFDEFIINPEFKETYITKESEKFREIYNTFYRESDTMIKCYFMGNPYSLYNPYFMWLGVDTKKLKVGEMLIGSNWAVWLYDLTPELRSWILSRNPLYEFDDSYRRYGFEGKATNDEKIRLSKLPVNYALNFVFRIEGVYLGIYRNKYYMEGVDRFFVREISEDQTSKIAYCFDFNELVDKCALTSQEDRYRFLSFKTALRKGLVSFEKIEYYYLVINIFNAI